ncbi:hypothetical protein F4212_06560 [Candidatus Poribacteria bacterium]|nr:hypothetical protein [Candidatus Poribacteria bacterium]
MNTYQTPFPGETPLAFDYFIAYRDMGPTRSLRALESIEIKGKKRGLRQIGRWSSEHVWQVRVEAYDADVIEAAATQAVEKRIKEVQDFIEDDISIASSIKKHFQARIQADPEMDPATYLKWMKVYDLARSWFMDHQSFESDTELGKPEGLVELLTLLQVDDPTPEITEGSPLAAIGTEANEETTS